MQGNTVGLDAAEKISAEHELIFKNKSLIRNDTHLSLIYFCAVLLLPFLVWGLEDSRVIFAWQGVMIMLSVGRWICGYMYNQIEKQFEHEFPANIISVLSLLYGLGWGVAGVLFIPENSSLELGLAALLLISLGGVGAVSYSAKPFIAIPYLLCVILPFTIVLFRDGGDYEFILGCFTGIITMMFCLATDRLHLMLDTALKFENQNEELLIGLEEKNRNLNGKLKREKILRETLEKEQIRNIDEHNELQNILSQIDHEVQSFTDKSIKLFRNINELNITNIEQEQPLLIEKIKGDASKLYQELEQSKTDSLDKPESKILNLTSQRNQKSNVLIVDDDQNECQKIESYLHAQGLTFKSVKNIPDALSTLCEWSSKDRHFSLIIANRWLPDMDGIGFSECLKNDKEFQSVPFVLINSGEKIPLGTIEKTGIDFIINKPVLPKNISDAISRLLPQVESEKNKNMDLPISNVSIKKIVDDAIQVSLPSSKRHNNEDNVIDQYVIDGLRSSAPENFTQIVNCYLDEIPLLIKELLNAYNKKNNHIIKKNLKEIGARSIHMGANRLVSMIKITEALIEKDDYVTGFDQLHELESEFIKIESRLLANLTHSAFLSEQSKH